MLSNKLLQEITENGRLTNENESQPESNIFEKVDASLIPTVLKLFC